MQYLDGKGKTSGWRRFWEGFCIVVGAVGAGRMLLESAGNIAAVVGAIISSGLALTGILSSR